MTVLQKTLETTISQGQLKIIERGEYPRELGVQFDSGMLRLDGATDRPYDGGTREYSFRFTMKKRGTTDIVIYDFLASDVARPELRVRVHEDIRPIAQYRVTVK